jgi:hypothetical protein
MSNWLAKSCLVVGKSTIRSAQSALRKMTCTKKTAVLFQASVDSVEEALLLGMMITLWQARHITLEVAVVEVIRL